VALRGTNGLSARRSIFKSFSDSNQAQFRITITDRNGRNLSADANLGSLEEVQEILWARANLAMDPVFGTIRDIWADCWTGRSTFGSGEDFAAFSCEFTNLTFCGPPPGNIVTSAWYNWPVSQWATRLKASFHEFGYVQLGAYEVNPNYLLARNALNLGEPGGERRIGSF